MTVSQKKKLDFIISIAFYSIIFLCMMTFVMIQPFGDGPDEVNRYKIVQFIQIHGTLPIGSDPEVLLYGYGASYAFQPILTYIIDGFLLRLPGLFTASFDVQLTAARMVNVFFGLAMAFFVRRISKKIFENPSTQWAFSLAVMFLPQNLFIHTYVNTDSMALLSIAMMIDACLLGMLSDYNRTSRIQLSLGIIFCALSYYNAYGVILCCFFLFTGHFLHISSLQGHKKLSFDWNSFLRKGLPVAGLVLLGSGWWFLRNALLYDGDFIGMNARRACSILTSIPEYNPLYRDTYQKLGISLYDMIFPTGYYTLLWKSFIAMFGPMIIPTHHYIYMSFKHLATLSLLGLCAPFLSSAMRFSSKRRKLFFDLNMLLAIVIPCFLCIYYSYTWEFQPQGRYLLPMLISFMYFMSIGMEKLIFLLSHIFSSKRLQMFVSQILYSLLYLFLTSALLYSVFFAMVPYYKLH